MANRLPEFKGKSFVEIPAFIPSANFLEGEFGKSVLKEYKERAEKDYANASALSVLSYKDGVVKGSNPFAVVLVNQIVGQEGLRVATQADLERVLKTNALPLRGKYEDTALVLRTKDNPNPYLAKDLMSQIKARNPKAKIPIMIPLSELELVTDTSYYPGLNFKLKDSAQVFHGLSVLNRSGNFSSEDIDVNTGLPMKVGDKGNRYFYTRDSGLSRLYLDWDLVADSDNGVLAGSGGYGRVVVVSAKGTRKNLEEHMSQLQHTFP